MDTFDALAPTYDPPVRLEEVHAWCKELGWQEGRSKAKWKRRRRQ
jgi:hypothetical protein